jgi:hypothetical protein
MGGAPQGAMRVASQIWQVVFASQTLQVFCLVFRKKAQYVVVKKNKHKRSKHQKVVQVFSSNNLDESCKAMKSNWCWPSNPRKNI